METVRCSGKKVERHFILVHGSCHGAWCWYKLTTSLRASGHRVTAVDLAGSGIDGRSIDQVGNHREYEQPLIDVMKSIPDGEKVVLVGHSFGGFGLALVMEMFPEKIQVAIFVTAVLPSVNSSPSLILQKLFEGRADTMDTQLTCSNGFLFGPVYLATTMYQRCSSEDLTLALSLIRTARSFMEELSVAPPYSIERFGSVKKVYIICKDDLAIKEEFQRWMIENSPVNEVKEIDGADHMPMLSKPEELHNHLMEIIKQ